MRKLLILALALLIPVSARAEKVSVLAKAGVNVNDARPDNQSQQWLRPSLEATFADSTHAIPFFLDLAPTFRIRWAGDWDIQGPSSPMVNEDYQVGLGMQAVGDYPGPLTAFRLDVWHDSNGQNEGSRGLNQGELSAEIASPDGKYGAQAGLGIIFKPEASMGPLLDMGGFLGRQMTGRFTGWFDALGYGKVTATARDFDNYDVTWVPANAGAPVKLGMFEMFVDGHHGPLDGFLLNATQRVNGVTVGLQKTGGF